MISTYCYVILPEMKVFVKEKSSYNFYRVLRMIWHNPGISRAELARMFDLDKSTITGIVSELVDTQLLRNEAPIKVANTPGRRPTGLGIRPDFGCVVGFYVDANSIKATVMDMRDNIIEILEIPVDIEGSMIVEQLEEAYRAVESSRGDCPVPILGIGLSFSAIVDHMEGVIIRSIPLDILEPIVIADALEEKLGIPVFLDNDANACAWGSLMMKKDSTLQNAIVSVSYLNRKLQNGDHYDVIGVGHSIVINGKVFFGDDHSTGEFQSILGSVKEGRQFATKYDSKQNILNQPEILVALLKEYARNLALLINTLNINSVIIAGDICSQAQYFTPILNNEVNENWPYGEKPPLNIDYLPKLDASSGAAGMVLERVFSLPELSDGLFRRQKWWGLIFEKAAQASTAT